MRVLVPVTNPLGGIRTYMLYNLMPLQEAGYRFTFLAPQGGSFDFFKKDVAAWEGVEFVDSAPENPFFSMAKTIREELRKRQCEYALIHAQGLRAGTEAAWARRGCAIPLLTTLHDVIVPGNDVPGRFKWLKKRISGFLTRRTTVIIPVSNDCEENHLSHFPEWKKGPCRLETIPNGIDVHGLCERFDRFSREGKAALREELGIAPGILLGGFFGRFMPQKGFLPLLQALTLLRRRGLGERFHLVATRDDFGYRSEYMDSVRENPELEAMVSFVPAQADITPLFAQVDMLVMPSLWEACPILPMEALVLGVPVIGSDAIGLREVLTETPALAPKSNDPEAIAKALERMIDDPETFKNKAREYAPEARNRFDVAHAVAKLKDLYDRESSA